MAVSWLEISIDGCRLWLLTGKSDKKVWTQYLSDLKIYGCMHPWPKIDRCSCIRRTHTNKGPAWETHHVWQSQQKDVGWQKILTTTNSSTTMSSLGSTTDNITIMTNWWNWPDFKWCLRMENAHQSLRFQEQVSRLLDQYTLIQLERFIMSVCEWGLALSMMVFDCLTIRRTWSKVYNGQMTLQQVGGRPCKTFRSISI